MTRASMRLLLACLLGVLLSAGTPLPLVGASTAAALGGGTR